MRDAGLIPEAPESGASRERTDALLDCLRGYAEERINSRLMDERRCIMPHIVLDFGNRGLLAMQVSPTVGGLGLRNADFLRVCEQLSAIDLTLALFVGNANTLGVRPIDRWAAAALREQLLLRTLHPSDCTGIILSRGMAA